jgi:hypothetical protein
VTALIRLRTVVFFWDLDERGHCHERALYHYPRTLLLAMAYDCSRT